MDAAVQALLDRGEESGCIEYSEVDEVAQTLDLEDEQVQELYEEIERRSIELKDNCARESAPAATYVNGDLAHATTDALQLFMNEVGRHRLLTAKEEVELAKRIERPTPTSSVNPQAKGPSPSDRLETRTGDLIGELRDDKTYYRARCEELQAELDRLRPEHAHL